MSTLLIDLEGHELKQEEVELLEHPLVAGLILFTRNFYDRQQVQALIKSIRQRVKKPLLVTVDQEGGRVQRFREGFTQLPAVSYTHLDVYKRQSCCCHACLVHTINKSSRQIDRTFYITAKTTITNRTTFVT